MNWDAIAALGEVAGAAAVVASVLYLALQVRSAARESRAASVHALQESINDWLSTAVEPETAALWHRGIQDFDALDPVDRVRFNAQIQVFFRIAEDAHSQHRLDRLPRDMWLAFEATFSAVAALPGVRRWWRLREAFFTPSFRTWVESRIDAGSEPIRYEFPENR